MANYNSWNDAELTVLLYEFKADLNAYLATRAPGGPRTLAQWREGFWSRINAIQTKGYHDMFVRMWDFYLAYCEGGFAERAIHTSQLVFAKPAARHWQLEFAAS